MKKIIQILCCVVLFACQHNEQPIIDSENLLLGKWSESVYENGIITFKRVVDFPSDAYAISFEENEMFKQHTSGWCGTPPLSFFVTEGSWKKEADILTVITNDYPEKYNWKLVEVNHNKLVLKNEPTEQEKDYNTLMDLFDNFFREVENVSCVDANDWKFVAYGAKACGGAKGHIAYPNSIDEADFLMKVEAYTQAEKEYNTKWNIASDCSVIAEPTHIVCENNDAILKY